MSLNKQMHFTVGEFARLCNVTKHTMYHYDAIGILKPEIIAENGYRYYSTTQLEVFYVISVLRELDMPLKSIKEYLDKRSPEELLLLLEKEEKLIDAKIAELKKMKKLIHQKAAVTKEAVQLHSKEIAQEFLPEEFLICTPFEDVSDDKKMAVALAEHILFCQQKDVYSPYCIGSSISLKSVMEKNYWAYNSFYTKVDRLKLYPFATTKPAGQYLVAYHQTGYYTVFNTYSKILQYAAQHHLHLQGNFYEDALLDELSVHGYEAYLLRISIRLDNTTEKCILNDSNK